jgi:hypothetical protein
VPAVGPGPTHRLLAELSAHCMKHRLSGLPEAWFATRGLAFDYVLFYDAEGRPGVAADQS